MRYLYAVIVMLSLVLALTEWTVLQNFKVMRFQGTVIEQQQRALIRCYGKPSNVSY